MLEGLLGTLVSSVMGGGATGLLGIVLQRFADYKNRQLDIALEKSRSEAEVARRNADLALIKEEYAGKVRMAQEETTAAREVADSNAFAKSLFTEPTRYSSDKGLTTNQQWLLVVLDFIRGVVRPLLTVYLCVLTTYIWWQVRQLLAVEDLDAQNVLLVWQKVVDTILYLSTTCILWWFGTRNKAVQPGSKA